MKSRMVYSLCLSLDRPQKPIGMRLKVASSKRSSMSCGSHHDGGCWIRCALRPSREDLHRGAGVHREDADARR